MKPSMSKILFRYVSNDFPGGSDSKVPAFNAGDPGSVPGSGRSPGEGSGKPLQDSCPEKLQYPCLENPMDRGAWQATVHRVTKSWTRLKRLRMHSMHSCFHAMMAKLSIHDRDCMFLKV